MTDTMLDPVLAALMVLVFAVALGLLKWRLALAARRPADTPLARAAGAIFLLGIFIYCGSELWSATTTGLVNGRGSRTYGFDDYPLSFVVHLGMVSLPFVVLALGAVLALLKRIRPRMFDRWLYRWRPPLDEPDKRRGGSDIV